jgi:hypothetical protein
MRCETTYNAQTENDEEDDSDVSEHFDFPLNGEGKVFEG